MAFLLSERIASDIENKIRNNSLSAGYIFPAERKVASHYNVSRTVIRQSFSMLEERNLVVKNEKGQTVVTYVNDESIIDTLRQMFIANETSFLDILEIREVLECAIAEKAVQYVTDESIRDLDDLMDSMNKYMSENKLDAFSEADQEFHMSIARVIPNTMFSLLLETVYRTEINTFALTKTVDTAMRDAQYEHSMILAGLKNRNAAQTRLAMQAQVENIRSDFRRMSLESETVGSKD